MIFLKLFYLLFGFYFVLSNLRNGIVEKRNVLFG